jgi:hypothetical protein
MSDQFTGDMLMGRWRKVDKIVPAPTRLVGGINFNTGNTNIHIGPEIDLDHLREFCSQAPMQPTSQVLLQEARW